MNFKEKLWNTAYANRHLKAIVDFTYSKEYTYQDLIDFSEGFRAMNIQHKKIGIFMDKSADYIAAVFSVTLSNNSFVPLDPSLPIDRLSFIINDANIDCVMTNENFHKHQLLSKINKPIVLLKKSSCQHEIVFEQDALFYTIYTSGTTGVPKGVELSFKGIDNVISQQVDLFELDHSNIYLFLSINFDASLSDIYCSLYSGSTLFIDESIKKEISKFIDFVKDNTISYIDIPPSFIKLIDPKTMPSLKSIVIGGEVADANTVCDYVKYMKVINVYGPTEATICTSYSICDKDWSIPYIGQPLKGVSYAVFDNNLNPVFSGEGELYISGIQLALGYTNPKLTTERFLKIDDIVYYKSGDKVSVTLSGIEFIGRIDRQIKHNGQLICLEEIEQTINCLKEIESVSVVYKNKKLYAYYEGSITKEKIIDFIGSMLPTYMIPHFFINNIIPKTANGKNDSKSLSSSNTLFEHILGLYSVILEMSDIDASKSFRELGADSINFIQLQEGLNKLGISIPYNYLFDNNTIEDIVNYKYYRQLTKNEIVMGFDFKTLKSPDTFNFISNRVALCTGANGSLGMHILNDIVDQYDKIYCLIRANNYNEAVDKWQKSKEDFSMTFNDSSIIIVPISNLADQYMGMNLEDYYTLSKQVGHIYHNAANVNNMKTYNELYNDNVIATVNVLNFSFTGLLKKVNYASTLSVYVSGEHSQNAIFYEDALTIDDEILFNGYSQTKWLCDYLMTYSNQYNTIKQFRLGLLVPETFTHKDHNSFLYQTLSLLKAADTVPYDIKKSCFDFTPVNWASSIIAAISVSDDSEHIYNVTTNKKVYYSTLVQQLDKEIINTATWFKTHSGYLTQLLSQLYKFEYKDMNLFEMTYVNTFDNAHVKAFIPDKSIDIDAMLKSYIDSI